MIIVHILAAIAGGICVLCVLGILALAIIFARAVIKPEDETEDETEMICAITGERCMYTSCHQGMCNSCPEADEFLENQGENGR